MDERKINYPIIEALCEFQFNPGQPWDMTIPGLIYERIKGEFSVKKQQMGFGIALQPKKGEFEQKIEMAPKIQFCRPDESALIQVGPNLLVVNHLKPYPKWGVFKPLILSNLSIYNEIANPINFKKILLRYINKFEFPGKSIELSDFFNFYPLIPQKLPQAHGPFNVRVEFNYKDGRDRLLLELTAVPSDQPDTICIIFDLFYILFMPDNFKINQASDWIETAHEEINAAFNASITEKCKTIFKDGSIPWD